MKNITYLKITVLQIALFTATLFGTSCGNSDAKAADARNAAEKQNDIEVDSINRVSDAQFLIHAALINLEEVKLGQLAQQNGSMKEVKALGKMMGEFHVKSTTDLTSLASQKGTSIPSATNNEIEDGYQKLSKKTGFDFDKEYCNRTVTGHHAAVDAFERASIEAADADIKAWATVTLPELRTHLEHAIACQKLCDKKEQIIAKTNKKK